ncbi:hypothetical protein BC833DRAFT_617522 [Globomyces pollinis-pini]|nr:hypothetical protein BC833DRAFT_617522 [Globomyces pollinis-pini]
MPGQALAYKVGELKIRELRAYAEKELGEKFHIGDFHDLVLNSGSVPLDVLEFNVKNWVIHNQCEDLPAINRSFEPFIYFADLQTAVESCFLGYSCILKLPVTPGIVGSQEELMFAYLEKIEEAPIFNLEVQLIKRAETKRKRSDNHEIDSTLDLTVSRRTDRGKHGEIELFDAAVKEFGCGKWRQVSNMIETRDIGQVRKFSQTILGRRYKPALILSEGYLNFAVGINQISLRHD